MTNVLLMSIFPEISDYAVYLGIDLPGEEFLLPLAREGITAQLPK